MTLQRIMLIIGIVLAVLASVGVGLAGISLGWLGLAFIGASFL